MITETGRIVAIEDDGLWVQTIRKSACASCQAQKGCGQAVLAKMGREPGYIRVAHDGSKDDFQLDQFVEIGIAEDVLMSASLLIYLLPLVTMITGILIVTLWQGPEWHSVVGGIAGLIGGGLVTRFILARGSRNERLQPILIKESLGTIEKPNVWP